jgi:hypothetical protein
MSIFDKIKARQAYDQMNDHNEYIPRFRGNGGTRRGCETLAATGVCHGRAFVCFLKRDEFEELIKGMSIYDKTKARQAYDQICGMGSSPGPGGDNELITLFRKNGGSEEAYETLAASGFGDIVLDFIGLDEFNELIKDMSILDKTKARQAYDQTFDPNELITLFRGTGGSEEACTTLAAGLYPLIMFGIF